MTCFDGRMQHSNINMHVVNCTRRGTFYSRTQDANLNARKIKCIHTQEQIMVLVPSVQAHLRHNTLQQEHT